MLKMDKILNHFKIRKFKDNILLVTEQGNWVVLTKKEYDDFICGDVNSNKKLDDLGLLIDKTNFEKIVAKQKSLYSQLFCGTSLHIVVPTLRCNLKCDYCHSRAKSESVSGYDMDEETARKTVDFIFQTPSKQVKIEFQGGEPLLNFDIVKYVIGYAEKLNKEKKKDLKSESGLFHCIYMTYIKHTYKDYKQNYPNITLEEMYKEINKLRIFGPGNMATALITSLYFAIPIYK